MKHVSFKLVAVAVVMFLTCTAVAQDAITVTAVYDGFDANGFNFKMKAEDGEDDYLTFPEIDEKIVKEFNLKTKEVINSAFQVMYKIETYTEEDDDGDEQEFTKFIVISLKRVY